MKKILVVILICLVVLPLTLYAKDTTTKTKFKADPSQPIQIVSDRLEAFSEKKMVVFSGNAVATQGDKSIRSDRISLFYRKGAPDKAAKSVKIQEDAGELERMEANGHVRVTQGDRIVTGDEAVFYQDQQKVVMIGNAIMKEGKNIIRGQKIVVFLDENRGVVEADENKRVTATIYPTEQKDKRK